MSSTPLWVDVDSRDAWNPDDPLPSCVVCMEPLFFDHVKVLTGDGMCEAHHLLHKRCFYDSRKHARRGDLIKCCVCRRKASAYEYADLLYHVPKKRARRSPIANVQTRYPVDDAVLGADVFVGGEEATLVEKGVRGASHCDFVKVAFKNGEVERVCKSSVTV